MTIMTSLFDDEHIMEIYAQDMAREAAIETARGKAALMLKKGKLSIDELAEFFPELSQEDIKELEEEVLQLR